MSFFDDFGLGRSARARKAIAELDLRPYVSKAIELFGLDSNDIVQAMQEYRHLLYLMYWNKRLEESTVVVPTELADKLWHAHILFTRDYTDMCKKVSGSYLHHQPGLQKRTIEHSIAMKRTRELHNYIKREGKTAGFDEGYFAELDPKPTPRREPARTRSRRKDESSSDSGSGALAFDPSFQGNNASSAATADDDRGGGSFFGGGSSGGGGASGDWGSGSSSSSSDSGGGSSCGGGGCGGGGD